MSLYKVVKCTTVIKIVNLILFLKNLFISFWLCWVFVAAWAVSSYGEWGLFSSCAGWAYPCDGFSCCGAWVLEQGLSSCGAGA